MCRVRSGASEIPASSPCCIFLRSSGVIARALGSPAKQCFVPVGASPPARIGNALANPAHCVQKMCAAINVVGNAIANLGEFFGILRRQRRQAYARENHSGGAFSGEKKYCARTRRASDHCTFPVLHVLPPTAF